MKNTVHKKYTIEKTGTKQNLFYKLKFNSIGSGSKSRQAQLNCIGRHKNETDLATTIDVTFIPMSVADIFLFASRVTFCRKKKQFLIKLSLSAMHFH
jgi:hypothetical protein